MPAGPSTLADLRKADVINSREIVAAMVTHMQDPGASSYHSASGHSLDIAALVALTISPKQIAH